MTQTNLTPAQFAAYTLASLMEPLPRGFILVSTGRGGLSAISGVDPDAEYPAVPPAHEYSQLVGHEVVLTVVNESGLKAAVQDVETVVRRLDGINIAATILASGEYLLDLETKRTTTLEAASASLPASLGRPTELRRWAPVRGLAFEPIEPDVGAVDTETVVDAWVHTVVTGRRPDQALVGQIAAAISDSSTRDQLLLAVARLGFDELDDASADEDVMAALLGGRGRPLGEQLVTGALAAQYVAAHTTDMQAAALLYDRSCSLANTARALVNTLMYPDWFTG
ncbi:hypothetical protein [Brachybacterium massiliense]|uniref:hypothetical protein n=1 Tax=Brachybacterium massiliense TaxID=1755098 RepID=UPI000B3BB846|nr:hypothetical protein [Brachybacterium massiliense]